MCTKKIISLILCLALALTILPVNAFDEYAVYDIAQSDTCTVSFGMPSNGSYAVGTPIDVTVSSGTLLSSVDLPVCIASVGYDFSGWSTANYLVDVNSYVVNSDVVLTPVFVASVTGESLAFNSSFEMSNAMPIGWVNVSGTTYRDTATYRDGGASLMLSGANASARQRFVPVVGGQTYQISAWFKVSNTSARPTISVSSYSSSVYIGNDASTTATKAFSTEGWTLMTLAYTPSAAANFMQLTFGSGVYEADVWVDSVSVVGSTDFVDSIGNHVKNGTFDSGLANWEIADGTSNASVSYDASVGYPSNGSALFTSTVTNPGAYGEGLYQVFPVEQGKTYEVSMYFKADVANARPEFQFTTYLGGSEIPAEGPTYTMTSGTPANAWTKFKTTYTAPQNAVVVGLLATVGSVSANGNVWIDSVTFSEKDDSVVSYAWNYTDQTGVTLTSLLGVTDGIINSGEDVSFMLISADGYTIDSVSYTVNGSTTVLSADWTGTYIIPAADITGDVTLNVVVSEDVVIPDIPEPTFSIAATNVSMGNNLDIMFAIPKSAVADWTGYYAVLTKEYADGRSDRVDIVPVDQWTTNGNYYVVTATGIAAKEMADDISVVIYDANGYAASFEFVQSMRNYEVGRQAVLGRQVLTTTPWLTARHGYDPTCSSRLERLLCSSYQGICRRQSKQSRYCTLRGMDNKSEAKRS